MGGPLAPCPYAIPCAVLPCACTNKFLGWAVHRAVSNCRGHCRISRTRATTRCHCCPSSGCALHTHAMAITLRVDVISDVICPWCYLGHVRMKRALRRLGNAAGLDLHVERRWVPYLLVPGLDPRRGSLKKRASYRRRMSEMAVAAMETKMGALFAAEGLQYELDGFIGSTLDAHRLAEWASDRGKQTELMEVLMERYHSAGISPADKAGLVEAAVEVRPTAVRHARVPGARTHGVECVSDRVRGMHRPMCQQVGLDGDAAADFLRGNGKINEVAGAVQTNRTRFPMLSGVPHFSVRVDGTASAEGKVARTVIPGAQDTEVFVAVLRRLLSKAGHLPPPGGRL